MGRVFDALKGSEERAEGMPMVKPRGAETKEVARQFEFFQEPPQLGLVDVPTEPFEKLKANMISLFGNDGIQAVLLVGTGHGCGCSTTAVGLASSMAKGLFKNVLLVDANLRTPDFHKRFHLDKAEASFNLSSAGDGSPTGPRKVGYGNLFVAACSCSTPLPVEIIGSSQFGAFLDSARARFDFIVIDGSPIPSFTDSLLIARQVDGVVVVVEAGKTSRQVGLAAKLAIERAGGRLLGVVLNKRRYFIPGWLYKHL
jgi:capsular exopolysaccharide synthesis family protein